MSSVDIFPDALVEAELGFLADMDVRPVFHANDATRDVLNVESHRVAIEDLRQRAVAPSLDIEGFRLFPHESQVTDFRNQDELERVHVPEIRNLLLEVSGANDVTVTSVGILRFSERSPDCGALNNSRPARFVHIDASDAAAAAFYERSRPAGAGDRAIKRAAQYNVWRVVSPPPQDVPLAVCDARSLSPEDLVPADAVFDVDGQVVMSFESLLLRHNPRQRWAYYSKMHPGEALVFKTNDTDAARAHCVAHGAFNDPTCPADAPPRASLEMRGIAYWYA